VYECELPWPPALHACLDRWFTVLVCLHLSNMFLWFWHFVVLYN
jgi:hypothetical protein